MLKALDNNWWEWSTRCFGFCYNGYPITKRNRKTFRRCLVKEKWHLITSKAKPFWKRKQAVSYIQ